MKDLLLEAARLKERGETFALATVVRCRRPASARPGARALIYPDGRMEGWVGGSCAKSVVVREAQVAMTLGTPRLLRLRGSGEPLDEVGDNVVEYPMTCHSGGTLEIYVEPHRPAPRLIVVGQSPLARALASLASSIGYSVTAVGPDVTAQDFPTAQHVVCQVDEALEGAQPPPYLVVASGGEYDEQALEQAARADLAYLAVVASPRRAAALRSYLVEQGVAEAAVAKIKAPAGLDLGAVEPEEIAVSILAEIIQVRRSPPVESLADTAQSVRLSGTAVDPICGMSVETATAAYVLELGGEKVYFCCATCKHRFETTASSSKVGPT